MMRKQQKDFIIWKLEASGVLKIVTMHQEQISYCTWQIQRMLKSAMRKV